MNSFVKYILSAVLVAICLSPNKGFAQSKNADGIVFIENNWAEALKQAARQKKYIFVDAYADWCGPCKMLKRTTFKNKDVAGFYNSNFINVTIDVESEKGAPLAQEWGVQYLPTLMVFNSSGKRVLFTSGAVDAATLLRFGKDALAKK